MQAPVIVVNSNTQRETGKKAQMSNIEAAKAVADVIRTCLGPRAMLKMLLDPMGGIVLTNDGNAILRDIDAAHPAAKSMIELSRTQDEEVGDGTTSVIILSGEILAMAAPLLQRSHPIVIIRGFRAALKDALATIESISKKVDVNSDDEMRSLLSTTLGTKFSCRWNDLMTNLALKAVRIVATPIEGIAPLTFDVDIKRYVRVERIPGGELEDSQVLDGILLNKDVTHPKMRRYIENPRIILLDCALEYKKGESQTNIEVSKETDWNRLLQIEEEQVAAMCTAVIAHKPDIVITEKGLSDLAQHYFVKAGITAIRRVKKTDNNRIAKAIGATIVNRVEDIKESDIGTKCGLFKVEKIGDEYFMSLVKCKDPKACTIVLRGPSKDILAEIDRNLHDALCVARNIYLNPMLAPGGGATEMAISSVLERNAAVSFHGPEGLAYKAVARALEVIPRTLCENCGGDSIRSLTALRAKHSTGAAAESVWGIDGTSGTSANMNILGIWEPSVVKQQTIKTAVEAACLILRVDDIVSGISKKKSQGSPSGPTEAESDNAE